MADGQDWSWKHTLGTSFTLAWAGFWLLGGIGAGIDPNSGTPLAAGIALGLALGIVPVVPFWWRWSRPARRSWRRRRDRHASQRARERLERLPSAVRDDWQRLESAHALVTRFVDDGWIEPAALVEVESQLERLEQLLAADRETDALGGAPSRLLVEQVHDLADLFVALADEAVEHQAVMARDVRVPVTLDEARHRLRHARQAYDDLPSPGRRRTSGEG